MAFEALLETAKTYRPAMLKLAFWENVLGIMRDRR